MKITKYCTCLIFMFLLKTFLSSCNSHPEQNGNVGKLYEKADTIKLPNNLIVYNPFNRGVLDSNQIANSTFKIYSFIDVSCPSCLTNLQNWNKVASELSKYKVPIILVCQSEDNFELIKYLCEKKDIPEFPFPFYFDDKKQFFILNKFLNPSPNNHTLLADRNNVVLASGDLTLSSKVKQSYIDAIKKNTDQ